MAEAVTGFQKDLGDKVTPGFVVPLGDVRLPNALHIFQTVWRDHGVL